MSREVVRVGTIACETVSENGCRSSYKFQWQRCVTDISVYSVAIFFCARRSPSCLRHVRTTNFSPGPVQLSHRMQRDYSSYTHCELESCLGWLITANLGAISEQIFLFLRHAFYIYVATSWVVPKYILMYYILCSLQSQKLNLLVHILYS